MAKGFEGLRDPRLLVAGIAAGMTLIGPATAAATAAGAGFVGTFGTAVLAFKGFEDQIKQGTALGQYLQGQIGGIRSEFAALGATASSAMAGDVIRGLSEIRRFLPTLTPEIESLAGHLGRAFNTSAGGLIAGLQNAMPLLEDGGKYAEILANEFADFTNSQDFKDFVAYAQRELPGVGEAVISLANGVKDLAVSLAPAGDDMLKIIDATGKLASGFSHVIDAVEWLRNSPLGQIGMAPEQIDKTTDANNRAAAAIGDHTSHLRSLQSATSPLALAIGVTNDVMAAAIAKNQGNARALEQVTADMFAQNNAAGLLKAMLDQLNGKSLDLASSQNAFDSALANSNKHIAANGKTIDRATTSLAGNSAAAVANRGELIRQVQAAEGVAVAMRDNGKSTEETRATMVKMRDEIIANAKEHGLNAQAVQKFIDKIYRIPKKVPPTKLEVETKPALASIAAFQKAIDELHGKSVTANVRYVYTGQQGPGGGHSTAGGQTFNANGNIYTAFAAGGFENHVAQIAPAGAMRLWAEPETGGEAYIPLAPSKRTRSKAIWEETGRLLGMGGDSNTVRLDDASVRAIAHALSGVTLRPTISAGSFDSAMGSRLR
jgi:hypothetical protein